MGTTPDAANADISRMACIVPATAAPLPCEARVNGGFL
jgi:hypothetical protein